MFFKNNKKEPSVKIEGSIIWKDKISLKITFGNNGGVIVIFIKEFSCDVKITSKKKKIKYLKCDFKSYDEARHNSLIVAEYLDLKANAKKDYPSEVSYIEGKDTNDEYLFTLRRKKSKIKAKVFKLGLGLGSTNPIFSADFDTFDEAKACINTLYKRKLF